MQLCNKAFLYVENLPVDLQLLQLWSLLREPRILKRGNGKSAELVCAGMELLATRLHGEV